MPSLGRWELLERAARGGAGDVWRARGPDGQQVAVKLLRGGSGSGERERRRLAEELRALLRVRDPHVVAVLDAGENDGLPYLVMEWIEGGTLAEQLGTRGPLHPVAAARLVELLARAMERCHAQGVLHRDLKPENVLLRAPGGEPVLVDFGLARDVAPSGSRTQLTQEGCALGTPGFWAPEQARGEVTRIGPRTDVYGLGGVLYAALTGVPPHPGESMLEVLAELEKGAPLPPSRRRAGIPAALDAVCARALAPDPAARHASAGELAGELAAFLAAPARARQRRRARPLLLGGVLLPLLVASGAVWWRARGAPAAARPAAIAVATPSTGGAAWAEEADERARVALLKAEEAARLRWEEVRPVLHLFETAAELAQSPGLRARARLGQGRYLVLRGRLEEGREALLPLAEQAGRTGEEARWWAAQALWLDDPGERRLPGELEALARGRPGTLHGLMADALLQLRWLREPEHGERLARQAAELEPGDREARLLLAEVLAGAGDPAVARAAAAELRALGESEPWDPRPALVAASLLPPGSPEQEHMVGQAIQQSEPTPLPSALKLRALGRLLRGELAAGRDDFERAARGRPQDVHARFGLAIACLAMDEERGARELRALAQQHPVRVRKLIDSLPSKLLRQVARDALR